MTKCPYCAEEIQDDAKVCKWCHSDLTVTRQAFLPQKSGKATASLVLGIFFFIFPAAVLAIIFGHLSRSEIRRSGGRLAGAGKALAGLILGYMGVAILPLLIIAAIAIPNLLRSRIAANQASAVGSLMVVNTAAVTYSSTYGSYPQSLAVLGPPEGSEGPSAAKAELIDGSLASGIKSGYAFTYRVTEADGNGRPIGYSVQADPEAPGQTGQNHYFTDQTDVIRFETDGPASKDSNPIGG